MANAEERVVTILAALRRAERTANARISNLESTNSHVTNARATILVDAVEAAEIAFTNDDYVKALRLIDGVYDLAQWREIKWRY